MKKLISVALLSLVVSTTASASNYVMCHFNSFTTVHGNQRYPVTSNHDVTIVNASNVNKSYQVSYKIFIEKKLIHIENLTVSIPAGKSFTESKLSTSMQLFPNKINLSASCETSVYSFSDTERGMIQGGGSIVIL